MIGNTFQTMFLLGANELATAPVEYGIEQQAAGFSETEWNLLTSETCWTQADQMKIASIIASAISITLKTGGLPAVPLPGAFCAAVICKLVKPCNRLLAAASCPESYDVMSASGLTGDSMQIITTKEQMTSLVVYFSSAEYGALENVAIDDLVAALVIVEQSKEA